ncbi:MAG: RloB domain-containing protein [Verrucomicrobiaceae bacterium]|nr:RloB domain-containing protein [Verrucomicrobiaceae bacterium]
MSTGRKPRPLGRDERTFLDDRLFVIATEDRYAAKQYFDILRTHVRSSRIKTHVLPTEDCRSSPKHVFDRLLEFERLHESHADDEKWLVLDTDHWIQDAHKKQLIEVFKLARQKGYSVAMSRPCFEIWLLLHHHADIASLSISKCEDVHPYLLTALGSYNKKHLHSAHYPLPAIHAAVQNAKVSDRDAHLDVPEGNGSRVYRIVEQILQSVPAHLRQGWPAP